MTEGEDAIKKAESILGEQKTDVSIPVSLPFESAREISKKLAILKLMDTSFAEGDRLAGGLRDRRPTDSIIGDGLPANHPESMLVILSQRFFQALEATQTDTETTISLSTTDIDFLNERLKPKQDSQSLQTGDKDIDEYWNQIMFAGNTSATATLITLNLSFVRAGGEPRPDFMKFYEGPLPTPNPSE